MIPTKKILLVDDDETSVFLTTKILKRVVKEPAIMSARDGLEALNKVTKACAEEICPDLIFLDIRMPVMDGFEFLEELQKSIDLKSNENTIKIVLLSSSRHHLDEARAKEYPVLGYIEKPITEIKLTKFLL